MTMTKSSKYKQQIKLVVLKSYSEMYEVESDIKNENTNFKTFWFRYARWYDVFTSQQWETTTQLLKQPAINAHKNKFSLLCTLSSVYLLNITQ